MKIVRSKNPWTLGDFLTAATKNTTGMGLGADGRLLRRRQFVGAVGVAS